IILLFVTVLIGIVVLAEFSEPSRVGAVRGTSVLVSGHVLLGVAAVVVWVAELLGQSARVAWLGTGALMAVGLLGLLILRRSTASVAQLDGHEAKPMPRGVLFAHGGAAALTVLVALFTAINLHHGPGAATQLEGKVQNHG